MTQSRALSPQDRRYLLALKEALGEAHRGPSAMPRKVVWMAINRSEAWYSRALDTDETETIPDAVDLRRIQAVTGDRRPLDVLAAWWGTGFTVKAEESVVDEASPADLLAETADADAAVLSKLIADAKDGKLTRQEAADLLPAAQRRLEQAQHLYEAALQASGAPILRVAK